MQQDHQRRYRRTRRNGALSVTGTCICALILAGCSSRATDSVAARTTIAAEPMSIDPLSQTPPLSTSALPTSVPSTLSTSALSTSALSTSTLPPHLPIPVPPANSPATPTASVGAAAVTAVQPPPATAPASPAVVRYVFPIETTARASFGRTHHDYPATDIFARCGAGVLAVVSGRIDELRRTDSWNKSVNDPATRGGLYVSIAGDDGVRFYSAHLQSIEETIVVGGHVDAGQLIGHVGKTGDASACHVHFGVSPECHTDEWWVRRGVIWPYAYLVAWRRGTFDSPVAEITAWSGAHPLACMSPSAMQPPAR